VKYFSNLRQTLGPGVDGWEVSLKGMMSIVVILGLVITSIYWGVNKFMLNDPSLPKSDRKKKKVSSYGFIMVHFLTATSSNLIRLFYRKSLSLA
jgi:ATP/ADP translocase